MTIGDYPEYLAVGYLLNQNMLKYDDVVTEVEYGGDLQVVVRTEHHTNFEARLKKRMPRDTSARAKAATTEIPGVVPPGGLAHRNFLATRKRTCRTGIRRVLAVSVQSGSQIISQAPLQLLQCAG
jgi:hypothetical protein